MSPNDSPQHSNTAADTVETVRLSGLWGPMVVLGFATAISMWVVWLVGHQPWLDLPAVISGPGMGLLVVIGGAHAGVAGG